MEDVDFDEVLRQLKMVTNELTTQISQRFNISKDDIREHNAVVSRAIEIIQKYEGATLENKWVGEE
jgi:hypothetical protein